MKRGQRGRRHSRRRAGPGARKQSQVSEKEEEITIESLAAGGDGVGHLADGRVAFVRLSAPGDRVRIAFPDTGGRFVRATSVELITASPARVDPVCEFFGHCGGCVWQHIAYRDQLSAKHEILRHAVTRIGGLIELPEVEMVASPKSYGYRSRTRLFVVGKDVGYRRWRSNEIESIDHCPILLPSLESELKTLSRHLNDQPEPSREGVEWELAAGSDGSVRSVPLSGPRQNAPEIAVKICGETVSISAGGFAQGNAAVLELLYSHVSEPLDPGPHGLLLELYAGAGFFTLPLARRFDRVVAIEFESGATRDLARNLSESGQSNVEIMTARVEEALTSCTGLRPDAVLLDPPRAGLGEGAAAAIVALDPKRIVYVSCDAATLARDLGLFTEAAGNGIRPYVLSKLTGLDLFPQTAHIEAIAVLDRAH